jgi:hypothetical protein
MSATEIQPIASGKRTAIVDMLRGWALLGVALMNYVPIIPFLTERGQIAQARYLHRITDIWQHCIFGQIMDNVQHAFWLWLCCTNTGTLPIKDITPLNFSPSVCFGCL